jgi:hypothetical protein
MTDKKISTKELIERMKATRRRPHKPELIEKFNKIVERDEKQEREQQEKKPAKKNRQVARGRRLNGFSDPFFGVQVVLRGDSQQERIC